MFKFSSRTKTRRQAVFTLTMPVAGSNIRREQRYGGCVAQSIGNSIFALFGAPVAHEDHSRRALYAALRLLEGIRGYSAKLREASNGPLEARVGVNTGEVVVRAITTDEGRSEYLPIGHSTSLAARMQALAPIGSIATTEQVRTLCDHYFALPQSFQPRSKGSASH